MKIFYLLTSHIRPSWGVGIILHHVQMLSKAGFDCVVVKENDLHVPEWLKIQVIIKDYNYLKSQVSDNDFLIVPEVMLNFPGLKKIKCRKIVFVQNVGYLFESMPKGEDHVSLGFQEVFINMPHMTKIIDKHVKLPYTMIPPFVPEYFFSDKLDVSRRRQILIYPKNHILDYSVAKYSIERYTEKVNTHWIKDMFKNKNWTLKELKDLSHEETAKEMKRSAFFISLNVFESMNASVTEAMAAGCIVFCYEGFGPRDYLQNKVNAFSFKNNEVYELVETFCSQICNFEKNEEQMRQMRQNAFETAKLYSQDSTAKALLAYFSHAADA